MDNKLTEENKEQWVAPKITVLSTQETLGGGPTPIDALGTELGGGGAS